jgi:NAD+ synthase (glutamine-hydrolysing)
VLLMAISNKTGRMLLTTGNKSEMAVGYATLYGDMAGGFAPIKDCSKMLVYRLARYRNTLSPAIPERVIEREPTAELRPDPEGYRLAAVLRGARSDPRGLHRG